MKWGLWLTFLVTVPVPFFLIETGLVPTTRLLLFSVFTSVAALAEPDFVSRLLAVLAVVQTALFAALLFLLAALVARGFERLGPRLRAPAFWLLVAVCFAASLFPIYATPFSRAGPSANLFGTLRY